MNEWHQAEQEKRWMDPEDAAIDGVTVLSRQRAGWEADGAALQSETPSNASWQSRQTQEKPAPQQESYLAEQVDKWLKSMERLQLSEYVRYVDDRKRMFWSSFWGGVARGVGMAVGFTILGAILVLILQNLAKRNLPLIGDALAQIVSIVQMRLK